MFFIIECELFKVAKTHDSPQTYMTLTFVFNVTGLVQT